MDRDKVTELLKNYRSYKFAVKNYESNHLPAASIASYSDMPRSIGFESSPPRFNNGLSIQDHIDYIEYKRAVEAIEGALETLTDNEKLVIEKKWMVGITLKNIEINYHYGTDYAKKIHRRALQKLSICLTFVDVPSIREVIHA